MFCPKCSQEQFSSEMQYCKNCGLQLNGIKELLAKSGAAQPTEMRKQFVSLSQRDLSIGAAGMFVFAFFAAMLTIDVPASQITPIVFLVIATFICLIVLNVIPMILNYLNERKNNFSTQDHLSSKATGSLPIEETRRETYLPPAQSIPADVMINVFSTNELERPPSVTENTTKHLKM